MTNYEKLSLKLLLFIAMQQAIHIEGDFKTMEEVEQNSEFFTSLSAEVQGAVNVSPGDGV